MSSTPRTPAAAAPPPIPVGAIIAASSPATGSTCSPFRSPCRNVISTSSTFSLISHKRWSKANCCSSRRSAIDVSEEDALKLSNYKTACLFSGCARLGGVLGGLGEEHEKALDDYGRYAGLAFQLVDDLLDFTASSEQLGKPVLSDLKEGKVTLPLIYAMQNGHSEAREMVACVLHEKEFLSVQPETLVALVRDSGALDRTRNLALEYAVRAKACLNGSGYSEYARALTTLPDFILDREY